MRELHDGFAAWVADGTRDELPRDLALHASGCDECMRQTAAFDALESVDLGAALPPPLRAARIRRTAGSLPVVRAASGALVVVVVLGTGAMAGRTLFGSRTPSPTSSPAAAAEATPAEGVLSGVPSFTPSPTASPTDSPSSAPSPMRSAEAESTPAVALATPRPTMGGGPPPIATARPATPAPVLVSPPPATPVPTLPPTVAPTPLPSASPSVAPTPTSTLPPAPSPEPDPTPSPSSLPSP